MIAGRYSLVREVGRGGMGAVWLARDELLGREVAVKRLGLMPGAGTPDRARAEREARLAAMLNHPHVVAVLDLATEGEETWLVMEYVDGESLAERLRRDGAMSAEEALPVATQCADALAAAHREGIVHRDVKPSNIMLGRTGVAKLTDFGIARAAADPALTQTGLVTGSPAYLAPEVASGHLATPASDVWSLGATLYHCLAGRPPYDVGDNVLGGLYKIVHEEPPRLEQPGPFGEVLAATMTRDPDDRWDMEQVLSHLRRVVAGGSDGSATRLMTAVAPAPAPAPAPRPAPRPAPTATRTDGSGERRTRSWVLPWLVAAAALVLVAVLGGVLLTQRDEGTQTSGRAPQPTESASESSTSPSPSPSPSPTESGTTPDPAQTQAAMETFVSDYLATAPTDSQTAFGLLTPAFQSASGGYSGYSGFWGTVESATPQSVSADPSSLVVSYEVQYVMKDGRQLGDTVQLQLVRSGDGFLIDGEA